MPKGSDTKSTTKSAAQLREEERKRRLAAEQAKREREAAQAQRSNARIDAIDKRDTPKTVTPVKPTATGTVTPAEAAHHVSHAQQIAQQTSADARNRLRRENGLPESTVVNDEEQARNKLVRSIERPSRDDDITVDDIMAEASGRTPTRTNRPTTVKPVGSLLTPAEMRERDRQKAGLPVSNVPAAASLLNKQQLQEQGARRRQTNRDPWNIPAKLPTANAALQGDGDDWMDEAVKGAKAGDTVRVYVLHGKRYTEEELRAAGVPDEIINALRGYSKAASTVQTTKAVQNWHYQTTEPTQEYIQRSFKEYEQQILTGDFKNEEERKQVFERYNELQGEYFGELLHNGSDAIASEIEKTEKALAKAQGSEDAANYTAAELRERARAEEGLAPSNIEAFDSLFYKRSEEIVNKPAQSNNTPVGVLSNKLAGLKQIYENSKQAELVDRIQKNGDANLFDRWYSVASESGQLKEGDALSKIASAFAGYGQSAEANYASDRLQKDYNERIGRIVSSIKNRGYTAEDIALYNAYRTTQDYNRDKARVNAFVDEHPVIGPLAAMGLTVGTSAIRTPLRLVSDAVTGGTGYSPVRELGGLTQEMTQRAAQNIEKTLGKGVSKVYQDSVSTAESFVLGMTTGPATEVLMGLNAAVDTYDEAINRGIDKENAIALGLTGGIFEALFEHLSLDKIRFFNSTRLRGFKGYAAMLVKSAFVEGMEEVSTDLANEIADYFVAGGLSNFNTALAQGMTVGQYAKQFGLSLADSFAGGAFGGLGFGLAGSIGTAGNIVRNTSQDIAAGRSITGQGDVTALIDEARASGDAKSIKLADKLEQQLKDGKNGTKTAGQLYNRMQSGTVEQAAAQRYKEIAQEKGVAVSEQEAEDAGRGVAAWSRNNRADRFSGEALDNEVGRQLIDEINDGAEWFDANQGERLDFARRTGVVDDNAGREMRTAEAVARRAQDVTKAIREGDSYTLVKNGFEGQYVGKEGQRSEARLGGIDSIGENNELMVVVDDDGKGGPHATAAFSVGEDAMEGTVQAADADTEILYLDAQAYLTGNADMAQPEQYGADYQYKDGATMSVAAANTALATYDSRVNPDAHGYMAWFFDAHKAGKSGVSWERYLSLYNQQGEAQWSGYITQEQLREAFRTGQMEFAPRNGVTRIGNRQLKTGEGAFLQVLDYVAKKLKFAIVAADDIAGKNGFVSSRADVAVISLDADAGRFMTAAFHEIHHLIVKELGDTAGRQVTDAVLDTYRTVVGKQRFNEDLAHYEELYKNEFSAEDRTWKVREEMAAQYFGSLAEDNIELLVKRIDGAGGKKLLAKVVDAIKAFRDAISEALRHLAGIDPATRAAMETDARNARKLFDRFIAAAEQTMEARETALTEQGETLRKAAETSAESGVRSAERKETSSYKSLKGATAEELSTLADAKQLLENGADSEEVRKRTGWFKGYDGKWRIEIDDSKMKLTLPEVLFGKEFARYTELNNRFEKGKSKRGEVSEMINLATELRDQLPKKLDDIVYHAALFEAYPELKNVRVEFAALGDLIDATYEDESNRIVINTSLLQNQDEMREALIHEIQHAVQDIEGLTGGADITTAGYDRYIRTVGEIEAYDVQNRIDLTAEERQNTRPDIDRTDVVFADGGETETSSRKVTDEDYLAAVERGDMAAAQKMVDEAAKAAGYDMHLYHGAKKGGGFTVFKDWQYFTANKEYANKYANREKAESLYDVYVKSDRLFDTRKSEDKRIFEQFRREYGMGDIMASGLPDWTDGYDLSDIIEENDLPFDGIILDEGTQFYPDEKEYVKRYRRVFSYVIRNSNQVKSADPVTYDDKGNVIPLSERFDEEKEDIRWSRKVMDARAVLAERTLGRDELGAMLDETAEFLRQARKTVDKAAYDAWIQGLRTGGRLPQRTALLKVVRQYNDPKVTGESNEALADRIVERLAEMTDAEYSVDALIYTLADAMYRRAAATEAADTTNESREAIREVTQGRKYYIADGEFNYLVEQTAGTRRGMNEVFRRVYGFTLYPQSEAERRGATDSVGSIPGELKKQGKSWQYEQDEGRGNLWAILGGSYDEDVMQDSDVSTALQLYEMRDDMLPQARTLEDDVRDRLKKEAPDAQTREQWVAETIYEEAYQDAARFAEDIIRLSPMRTLADAYEGTMEELRQAAKGVLAKRAKEIAAIAERLDAAETALGRAGDISEEQRQEAARLERQVKNLEDQLSVARYDLQKAKDAGQKDTAALEQRITQLEKKSADNAAELRKLNNAVRAEQRKVARRDAKIQATRQYYIQKRHEETLKRADSASRKKALKKIEGQVRWLRDRFERPTTAQHVPARLRELLKPFIDAFLQEPTKDSGNTTLFTKDMIERLSLFYAGLEDGKNQDGSDKENSDSDPLFGRTQKYITELLDELRRRLSDKKLNSRNKAERLDADELDAISKVLANVIKIVREENTMFVDGKRVKYHESGHALQRTIKDAKTSGKAADFKKAMNKLRTHNKFQMGMLKPIYFFNKVIGGEMEKYFNDIREAQNRWAFRVQEASQFFAKTTKQYNYFKWRDGKDSFLLDNGSAVVLTKDAVMQLYVTHEREKRSPTPTNHLFGGGMVLSDELLKLQKKKNLTGDMKGKDYTFVTSLAQSLTLDDLQRMFSTLSKEQKDYANAVVGYMSSTVAEWGNEASREMLGFDNFTEPYYFPYVVSGSYLTSKVGQQNDIRLKNIGFTHALTQKASKPIVVEGFSDIAAKHVGSMASYSTLALPLDNLQRIRNYRDKETGETVASLMKEVYGSNDAFSYISTFLEQMNGAVRTDNTVGFLEKGLGWYKRNAVALNLSVVVQQPSAIARAMAIIPRRYFVGLPHLTEYKELKQYSGVAVVKEMGGWDTDTGRATQQYILGDFTAAQKISEKTGWLANKADEITWSQIWNAVKRETAKEMGLTYRGHHKMSEEFYQAAAKRFNDVADYSQVYDSTLSRSQFMRSKNSLAKVLTAFMAEPTTTYNMLLFGNLGEEHKAAATASIVLALLGNAVLNDLLKSLVKAWRDWDDEPYWERYIKDVVQGLVGKAGGSKLKWVNSIPGLSNLITSELNPLNDVVFVKDVISYLQGYEVENMYLSVIGDLINTVETAYNKIEKMGDSADWKDWVDVIGPVVTKLTALTPIPLQSIFRDTWTWSRNEEQRMRNRGLEELEDYKNLLAEARDAGSFAKGLQVIADKFGYTGFAQHMRNMLEQTFKGEWDENEQLYNAILQGDKHALEKYTRVTKEDIARYTDEANDEFLATEHAQDAKTKQYHTKVQTALQQMDSRIEEAARALLDNDLAKAQRLAEAIAKDGFDLQDVYNAIHKTRNDLKPPEPYEKKEAKDAYLATYDMLQEAYEEGDLDFAAAIRNDMIVNQGKADKDVDSKIAGYVKNEVENGEISYADARKALEDFTTLTAKDIDGKMVTYINDAFKAGDLTLAEAKKAYEDFTGYNDATVKSKLITQIGYRYANLDDMSYDEVKEMYQEIGMNEARIGSRAATLVVNDYKNGRITDKEEAVRQYIEQSGIDDEDEARRQFDYIDFTADMPEIDLSRTDYDAWVTTVEPAGVDFDTFYTFTVETKGMSGDTAEAKHQYFADNNSKGFGIKQAQVLPVIAKLPISNTQKDEIYKAYGWSAKKLDYTPWNNPGYWSGLLD